MKVRIKGTVILIARFKGTVILIARFKITVPLIARFKIYVPLIGPLIQFACRTAGHPRVSLTSFPAQ